MLPLAMVTGVIGFELLFRGLCQGIMINGYPVMLWTGRRFLSVPNVVAALISTATVVLLTLPPFWLGGGAVSFVLWIAAAFAMGLGCGAARERSGSVWAAVILHMLSVAVAWALLPKLFGT